MKKEKIKVSEKERLRRKELQLPVTKPLRYMKSERGEYIEIGVVDYEIVDTYMPSKTQSLIIKLVTGETIRILAPYFSHMQKPSFVDDMKKAFDDIDEE